MKKIVISSLVITASCLVLFFSGIYIADKRGTAIFLFSLFYGLFPVLWGILLKRFTPKWGYMLLSYFSAGILYGLVIAALTKAGVVLVPSPDMAYLGLVVGYLFAYLFTLPAALVSFAVTKSLSNIQSVKIRKIMPVVACICAVLYIAVIILINDFTVGLVLYTPHDINQ